MDNREIYLQFYSQPHSGNILLYPLSAGFSNHNLFPIFFTTLDDNELNSRISYYAYEQRDATITGNIIRFEKAEKEILKILNSEWNLITYKLSSINLEFADFTEALNQLVIDETIREYAKLLSVILQKRPPQIQKHNVMSNSTINTISPSNKHINKDFVEKGLATITKNVFIESINTYNVDRFLSIFGKLKLPERLNPLNYANKFSWIPLYRKHYAIKSIITDFHTEHEMYLSDILKSGEALKQQISKSCSKIFENNTLDGQFLTINMFSSENLNIVDQMISMEFEKYLINHMEIDNGDIALSKEYKDTHNNNGSVNLDDLQKNIGVQEHQKIFDAEAKGISVTDNILDFALSLKEYQNLDLDFSLAQTAQKISLLKTNFADLDDRDISIITDLNVFNSVFKLVTNQSRIDFNSKQNRVVSSLSGCYKLDTNKQAKLDNILKVFQLLEKAGLIVNDFSTIETESKDFTLSNTTVAIKDLKYGSPIGDILKATRPDRIIDTIKFQWFGTKHKETFKVSDIKFFDKLKIIPVNTTSLRLYDKLKETLHTNDRNIRFSGHYINIDINNRIKFYSIPIKHSSLISSSTFSKHYKDSSQQAYEQFDFKDKELSNNRIIRLTEKKKNEYALHPQDIRLSSLKKQTLKSSELKSLDREQNKVVTVRSDISYGYRNTRPIHVTVQELYQRLNDKIILTHKSENLIFDKHKEVFGDEKLKLVKNEPVEIIIQRSYKPLKKLMKNGGYKNSRIDAFVKNKIVGQGNSRIGSLDKPLKESITTPKDKLLYEDSTMQKELILMDINEFIKVSEYDISVIRDILGFDRDPHLDSPITLESRLVSVDRITSKKDSTPISKDIMFALKGKKADIYLNLEVEIDIKKAEHIIQLFNEGKKIEHQLKDSYEAGIKLINHASKDLYNSGQILQNDKYKPTKFTDANNIIGLHYNKRNAIIYSDGALEFDKLRYNTIMDEFIYTEMFRRWYFLPNDPDDGPYDWIILPKDFPYAQHPEYGIKEHPIPIGGNRALNEIPVSVKKIENVTQFGYELWDAHIALYSRYTGEQALKHFVNLIYDWLTEYLPEKICYMPQYHPDARDDDRVKQNDLERYPEEYWRIYRWIRWYAEALILNIPISDKKKLNGNIYINTLLKDMASYFSNHHGEFKGPDVPESSVFNKTKGVRHRWMWKPKN